MRTELWKTWNHWAVWNNPDRNSPSTTMPIARLAIVRFMLWFGLHVSPEGMCWRSDPSWWRCLEVRGTMKCGLVERRWDVRLRSWSVHGEPNSSSPIVHFLCFLTTTRWAAWLHRTHPSSWSVSPQAEATGPSNYGRKLQKPWPKIHPSSYVAVQLKYFSTAKES